MIAPYNFPTLMFKRVVSLILPLLVFGLTMEVTSAAVVTNTADSRPGSLGQLIASATPGGTITFATYLSGSTIALNNGQLTLSNYLTIDASALPGGVQIIGNGTSRIFSLASGDTVVLTALTIMNGHDQTRSGGGGIYNNNLMCLNQCTRFL